MVFDIFIGMVVGSCVATFIIGLCEANGDDEEEDEGFSEQYNSVLMNIYADVRERYPELRACQVMAFAAHKAGWESADLFYCPDDTIMKGLEMMLEERESEENHGYYAG